LFFQKPEGSSKGKPEEVFQVDFRTNPAVMGGAWCRALEGRTMLAIQRYETGIIAFRA
jgi:hypothetical protein